MTTTEKGTDELSAARELVRAAAKWFVAGLGAIGVVLVAGSQLSSVGGLPSDSSRLWIAIAGVLVGLLAILWAMWKVVEVLAGYQWTFEDLVAEWNAANPEGASKFKKWRIRQSHPIGQFLRASAATSLGGFESPAEINKIYAESEPDREGLNDLVALMNSLLDKAATIHLNARFRALRRQIACGVLLGAAGIILFAWAANPPKVEQPPASLRNADMRQADLRGASLRNADLTNADMTGANLLGADLRGATIDDTIWSDTVCPDGVNSDTSARTIQAGKPVSPTCQGHLIPVGAR